MRPITNEHLEGLRLYGDDFTAEELEEWYRAEAYGYYNLVRGSTILHEPEYQYNALNYFHGFARLKAKSFGTCLALGCADGSDVEQISHRVNNFIAVEPARKWWRSSICGRPCQYMEPDISGDILLENNTVDVATSFGVLHHIPNVSHVLKEIHRVLAPEGYFVAREPISSMGDFRTEREGCTKYERGIPIAFWEETLKACGFSEIEIRPVMLSPFLTVWFKFFGRSATASPLGVRIDSLLCRLTNFNKTYYRDSFFKKIAPGACFIIARK